MNVIAGKYRHRNLEVMRTDETRPTMNFVKESMFNSIGNIDDFFVIDLFAGSGQLGIEALSRNAKQCLFVDNSLEAQKVIKKNLSNLNIKNYNILFCDYKKALIKIKNENTKVDLLILDPPYKEKINKEIIMFFLENNLLSERAMIISEQDSENEKIDGLQLRNYKYSFKHVGVYRR